MKLTVDRIENGVAVVMNDAGKRFDIPAEILPDAEEGNIYNIILDEKEKTERLERIKKLADELWK